MNNLIAVLLLTVTFGAHSADLVKVIDKCDHAPTTLAESNCKAENINTKVQFTGVVYDVIDEYHANIDSDDGPYVDVYFKNPIGHSLAKDQRVKISGVLTSFGIVEPDVKEATLDGIPENKSEKSKSSKTSQKEKPREPGCWSDLKLCKDNADVMKSNSQGIIGESKVSCKQAAEKENGYEVDWGGWLEPNFTSFGLGDSALTTGTIWLKDNVAKYQNAYGAKRKAVTMCLYNINTKTVESIVIQ